MSVPLCRRSSYFLSRARWQRECLKAAEDLESRTKGMYPSARVAIAVWKAILPAFSYGMRSSNTAMMYRLHKTTPARHTPTPTPLLFRNSDYS